MSDARKKPKVFALPVKVAPYVSVPVKEDWHAIPHRIQPVRDSSREREPGALVVDGYAGQKPPGV